MKRLLAAAVLSAALMSPTPAEAHSISCAAYVGNPCYQTAKVHAWWHKCIRDGLARVSHGQASRHRVPPGVVRRCTAQLKKATR